MNLRERVARNLRRLRQEKSVSQEELAHLAQVNRNYVGMLEREEYAASIDMLEKLALALDIDPIPLIVIEIIASNIGGTATLIGDPPNIIIAGATDLSFNEFLVMRSAAQEAEVRQAMQFGVRGKLC